MNASDILLSRHQVAVSDDVRPSGDVFALAPQSRRAIGTLVSNFLYFGFIPSQEVLQVLGQLNEADLKAWWNEIEPALKAITADDKNIGDHIVYQNFPAEVLAMSEADYWMRQLFIYFGTDPRYLQNEKEARPQMFEEVELTVLQLARPNALNRIFESLLSRPAAWTEQDKKEVEWFILQDYPVAVEIPFKENLVFVAIRCLWVNKSIQLSTATDVLRLAAGIAEGDISLKEPTKFRLRRAERRYLLMLLDQVNDLAEGVMRHYETWKRLFHQLHVGEYQDKYPDIYRVATALRRGEKFLTFNSRVEALLEEKDPAVLPLLATRPGEFTRRIVALLPHFGEELLRHLLPVLPKLETLKLLKLKRFLLALNQRRYRVFTPQGNWRKAKFVPNNVRIDRKYREPIVLAIDEIIARRISKKFGQKFHHHPDIDRIKLPTNDAKAVTRFTKGTRIPLPDNIRFIRTATFWKEKGSTCWMDNGWNFFNKIWSDLGVCCWDHTHEMGGAAVFSGDPVNSYDPEGKAGQLIDLYLDKLKRRKVRYAVWNILSYNSKPFDDLEEVMGLLMMGEEAEKGKLIEPSRVTFAVPVTGNGLTKYLLYLDLEEREIVICDAGLNANVSSASANSGKLEDAMPAFSEYLDAIPSLMDIFELFPSSEDEDAIKVLYSDEGVSIQDESAYVFAPRNEDNSFAPLSLEDFLTAGE